MWKEFREFIKRGNVIDLAVAVVIGAAFAKIVTAFVDGVIMPVAGLLVGRVDFSDLFVDLSGKGYPSLAAAKEAGAPVIAYGALVNSIINFLIVAIAVFLMVKAINKLRREKEEAPPATKECPLCLSTIPVHARKCAYCTVDLSTVPTTA